MIFGAFLVHRFFAWYGWPALVAMGTIGLAFATFGVVRATKALAARTEAEIAAQWRPVLLVRDRLVDEAMKPEIAYQDGSLYLWVENVGRGPALNVQPWLEDFPAPGPAYGVPADVPPGRAGAMGSRLYTVIAEGDLVRYRWSDLGEPRDYVRGRLDYSDLSGSQHGSTRFAIEARGGRPTLGVQLVGVEPVAPYPRRRLGRRPSESSARLD